jgi:hypothetical protein
MDKLYMPVDYQRLIWSANGSVNKQSPREGEMTVRIGMNGFGRMGRLVGTLLSALTLTGIHPHILT